MAIQEFQPVIRNQGGYIRCEDIPGLFGPTKDVNTFLDKLITQAEMVGQIVERYDPNDEKGRKIDIPKPGSSADFLTKVYKKTKDLSIPEEKRQRVFEMFRAL